MRNARGPWPSSLACRSWPVYLSWCDTLFCGRRHGRPGYARCTRRRSFGGGAEVFGIRCRLRCELVAPACPARAERAGEELESGTAEEAFHPGVGFRRLLGV